MHAKLLEKLEWERDKRLIKSSGFKGYCQIFGPDLCPGFEFEMAPHHLLMVDELETAMNEHEYNVMFLMPPGFAKSTYSSILFPSYFLAERPGYPIIACEHTTNLAEHFGRQTRNIIQNPFYQYYSNTSLSKDSSSALRFGLMNGASYLGAGVGTGIPGRRARLGLIDDPTKGEEAAFSELQRDKVWRWYLFDFQTRLLPGASQVMSVTTWHEDDLPNRILNSAQGKYWKVIRLPALAEENDILGRKIGDPLWPKVYPLEKMLKIKEGYKNDIKAWESLYQQHPTVEDGDYFKKEWFQFINKVPKGLKYYGASDYAVTNGRGDHTVHLIAGYDEITDDIYIVHIWREQKETNVWIEEFLDLVEKYEPLIWAEERGQIIQSLDPYIRKEMQNPKRRFVFREQFTSSQKKTVRAQSFRGYMAQKKVFILNAEWTRALEKEMLSFPDGSFDDQVDALGLIGRMLDDMYKRVEKSPKTEDYEYKSGSIVLPGLDFKINRPRAGLRNKI